MELWILIENEFFEGDHTSSSCIGVFSSEDKAHECIMEIEATNVFDPMFRTSYETIHANLDVPVLANEEPELD